MARKRLGDLLRQEADKPQESEEGTQTPATIDIKAVPVEAETKGQGHQAKKTEHSEKNIGGVGMEMKDSAITGLNANITELKDALQEAGTKETELQTHIDQLKSGLQEQTEVIQGFQQDQNQVEKLKGELEKAKQTILQLTEINSPDKAAKQSTAAKQATTGKQATAGKLQKLETDSAKPDLRSHKALIGRLPNNYVHPHEVPRMSDMEIGWFD